MSKYPIAGQQLKSAISWLLNILDPSQSEPRLKLSMSFLILDPLIYGYLHLLAKVMDASSIIDTIQLKVQLTKLMELLSYLNTDQDPFLVFGHTIPLLGLVKLSLELNLDRLIRC